jgi:hypothetical protein
VDVTAVLSPGEGPRQSMSRLYPGEGEWLGAGDLELMRVDLSGCMYQATAASCHMQRSECLAGGFAGNGVVERNGA